MADPHPWYGPCDDMAPDNGCAECAAMAEVEGYADRKRNAWDMRQSIEAKRAEIEARKSGGNKHGRN